MGMLETQSAETKILITESIMAARENAKLNADKSLDQTDSIVQSAARENANFSADKSLDQTDSLVQTKMNEFKLSSDGNFGHDQAQIISSDIAEAEQKGFLMEQSPGVAQSAETKILIKESIMAARENAKFNADKSLDHTESLVQSAEAKILIKESITEARENAELNADKSLDQTDSLVQTNMNEFKLSSDGNCRHDQAQIMSNDSAVAEQKGFLEQSPGVAQSAETEIFINKESIITARENAYKSLNQTDSLVQTTKNEFKLSGAGNFRHDQAQGMSNDSAGAEEKGFSKEQSPGVADHHQMNGGDDFDGNPLVLTESLVAAGGNAAKKKKAGSSRGKKKTKSKRTNSAQRKIKRTVFVSDIDNEIAEVQLAALFTSCGEIVDCRICGDPKSALRFGFVEFSVKEGARNALSLAGMMLGSHTVKVQPSKTAIAPVNQNLLPRSEDEIERCTRTIYITNIDKKVIPEDVRLFFESFCGEVLCLKLLNDRRHSTCIGFLEFVTPESAIAALKCSGVILGDLPIRVSPSKTPIKKGVPRRTNQ
ncbi:uncharacterized protein LOC141692812 isoform X2 [Apium graveolens]|uniref:uncharacterized protein LOC141692812 isoform X2 n=1 Tax=Apium graveolens TaxID=4045 RepID=UPI003D79C7E9